MGIIEDLDECSINASMRRNERQLSSVRDRLGALQKKYGEELERYTFDDDGTGQSVVRGLESEIQGLIREEQDLKMAIHRQRILEKYIADQASKRQ